MYFHFMKQPNAAFPSLLYHWSLYFGCIKRTVFGNFRRLLRLGDFNGSLFPAATKAVASVRRSIQMYPNQSRYFLPLNRAHIGNFSTCQILPSLKVVCFFRLNAFFLYLYEVQGASQPKPIHRRRRCLGLKPGLRLSGERTQQGGLPGSLHACLPAIVQRL